MILVFADDLTGAAEAGGVTHASGLTTYLVRAPDAELPEDADAVVCDMDAREVAATLIKANTRQGCVTETEFSEVLLNVQFVCNGGLGNSTVRFDQVDKVFLQKSHDWYMVRVEHKNGLNPFEWSSKILGDMEKLADALHITLRRGTSIHLVVVVDKRQELALSRSVICGHGSHLHTCASSIPCNMVTRRRWLVDSTSCVANS